MIRNSEPIENNHSSRFHNNEPRLSDYGDFGQWIMNFNELKISTSMITRNFFREIFRHLEVNDMCFSSGSLVFEDELNVVFNLLTFNKLKIEENSYYCDDPLGKNTTEQIVKPESSVHIIGTDTHRTFYDKSIKTKLIEIKPRECMPAMRGVLRRKLEKSNTRFERVLPREMKNICGICENTDEDISEPKGVIMYYPFYVGAEDYPFPPARRVVNMLFVKFEGHPVSGAALQHGLQLIGRVTGTKKEYPNPRREDDKNPKCVYDQMYANKDYEFYRAYSPEDIDILNWYNEKIRTGCEFFISKGLLQYFLKFLFGSFNCDVSSIEKMDNQQYPPKVESLTSSVDNFGGKKKYKSKKYRKINKTRKNKIRKNSRRKH